MTTTISNKEYYASNKERIKARVMDNYYADPETHNARCRAWIAANPDKRRVLQRRSEASRRAKKRSAFVETVDPQTVFDRDDGICQICHEPIGESKWHIDHVMPLIAGGQHSYENTQLAHAYCNMRKGARIPDAVVG